MAAAEATERGASFARVAVACAASAAAPPADAAWGTAALLSFELASAAVVLFEELPWKALTVTRTSNPTAANAAVPWAKRSGATVRERGAEAGALAI